MATIHKLTKDGATIFPATITDAVVHPQTGKTLTSMMKDYNVSELFPTEGVDGGNKYNLALAIQVLGTHLTSAQKTGGIKLMFISSLSPYPTEEYYLGKSSWSGNAADWDQRFEVGDVVADPSGSWEPGTAEAYIDQQVGILNTNITNETIARQTADQSLQTQINAEATTRANVDNTKADKATTLAGYGITNAYTKTEVNDLVDTPHQNYVTVQTYSALPETGSADTIYRVSNYDGSVPEVNVTKYSEYAWQGTQYIFLCVKSQIDEVFDITVYHSNTTYSDLTTALGTDGANIPSTLRRGGMSIKYVQTSDNTYVQYRLMSDTFNTTPANWQGVDDEPTAGSDNLVKSGGVANGLDNLNLLTGLELKESSKDLAVGSIYTGIVITYVKDCLYDKNYIRVLPNSLLNIIKAPDILVRITQYDENKIYITQGGEYYQDITSVVIDQNTKFIRISASYINRGFSDENPVTIDDYQEGDFGILIPQSDKIDKKCGSYFNGYGANYSAKKLSCIAPNRKYLFFINYKSWKHTSAVSGYGFKVSYYKKDGTEVQLLGFDYQSYALIKPSYILTIGDDTDGILEVGGRADVGETINFTLSDVTDLFDIYEHQKRLENNENLSSNILCIETSTDNVDIDYAGKIIPFDRRVSDYIYCKGQTHISGTYHDSRVAFYGRDREFISVESQETGVVEVPEDAYYARIAFSHYRNNDYFIFGNNPDLSTNDYVPYGSLYLKDYIDKAVSDVGNMDIIEESINNYHRNEYAYNVFDFNGEHSSNNDRLYINIPANTPFKLNINSDNLNGNVYAACYMRYSDDTVEYITNIPFSKTAYLTTVKAKDITSVGFYFNPIGSTKGQAFSSVTIVKENDTIPQYWLSHLSNKIKEIHTYDENTSFNGDMFVFLTDYHIEQNSGISHKLIKYIVDRTNVDKVIFGGDAFNGGATRDIALEKLRTMKERFAPLNVIGLRGNHEYNLNDGGSPAEQLTDSEIFANISNKHKETGVIRPSNDVMYGYLDNEELKLRYIFLDARYELNTDPIDDTQLNWMASKMVELDSSWTILIFSHQFRTDTGEFRPSGQKIADKIQQTNYTATLAAVIYGHEHKDFYHNDLGYLDIATTCDSRQESGSWNQGAGTTDEQAFDVFAINVLDRTIKAVRIGRHGDNPNREWNY